MIKKIWMLALAVLFAAGLAGTSYAASAIQFSGEERVRATSVSTEDASGRGFIENRIRLNVSAKPNENMRVFISLQDSRNWGTEANTASTSLSNATATDSGVDLSEGYIEFSNVLGREITIRAGRQAIALGNHRLVGNFDWSNTSRRFDSVTLNYSPNDEVNIFAWYSKVKEYGFVDPDIDFNGVYATIKSIPHNTLALYLMNQTGGTQGTGLTTAEKTGSRGSDFNQITAAARLYGGIMGIDWNLEYANQSGDYDSTTSIDADALSVTAGYTIPGTPSLRFGVGYDAASGEDNDASTMTKFDNLYPTNHYKYGYFNDVNWTDMKAFYFNVSVKPLPKLKLIAQYWDLKKDQEAAVVGGGTSDDNGTEINLRGIYKANSNTTFEFQLAQREAGDLEVASGYVGSAGPQHLAAGNTSTLAIAFVHVYF